VDEGTSRCAKHAVRGRFPMIGRGKLPGAYAKRECRRLSAMMKWEAPTEDAAEAARFWSWRCSHVNPKHAHRIEPLFARSPG
jgi:hypothetical protein